MQARRFVVMTVALVVAVAALSPVDPSAAAAPHRVQAALRLPALHAEPDPSSGGRIVDADGRQVLLRGVNVNALAEYWQHGDFPTTFPLTAADADLMAGIGWNAVRLLVSWSRVEPEPGVYDDSYVAKVASAVKLLASRGIYTIIDLHQDAWGSTLVAPAGQQCQTGSTPAFGWDGAPGWATLDGGAPRCAVAGIRELSPAVQAAFAAFWSDATGPGGVGIQTRYVRMLGHLAGRFARWSAVAGYDVMNEPNAFSSEQQTALAAFYARSLRSIRAAERRANGHRHLFLFEPGALWSAVGRGAPPDFARDRDVVYAPHLYTGGFTADQPITEAAFAVAREEARGFGGAPVLSGEWGTGPDRAGAAGGSYFDRHQVLQDQFQIGATLWTWRESCGDPHKAGDFRAGRVPDVWGEFEVDCMTNDVTGVRTALVEDLTRGYPRAVPGRLRKTSYDAESLSLSVSGVAPKGRARLVVFYPGRVHARQVARTGLSDLRARAAPGTGTYLTARARGGAWTLHVGPCAAVSPRVAPSPSPS